MNHNKKIKWKLKLSKWLQQPKIDMPTINSKEKVQNMECKVFNWDFKKE